MTYELDPSGTITVTVGDDGPVDPNQFRETLADALRQHQDASVTLDLRAATPLDAPTLAVVVQTWLATSDRGCELTVQATDPADRAMLDRLGFDDFYRVLDAA